MSLLTSQVNWINDDKVEDHKVPQNCLLGLPITPQHPTVKLGFLSVRIMNMLDSFLLYFASMKTDFCVILKWS